MLLEIKLHDARMDGREEGLAAGREEGLAEGRVKRNYEIALKMLKYKESLEKIIAYADLSKEEVYALAQANGLTVIE